jgi:hypothetical protein
VIDSDEGATVTSEIELPPQVIHNRSLASTAMSNLPFRSKFRILTVQLASRFASFVTIARMNATSLDLTRATSDSYGSPRRIGC